jgi:hypothetical protein
MEMKKKGKRQRSSSKYGQMAKAVQYLSPILLPHTGMARSPGKNAHHEKILSKAEAWFLGGNLIGMAVGVKYTNGIPESSGPPCLKFYVQRKLAKSRMRRAEVIPPLITLEDLETEFVTDIDSLHEFPKAHLDGRFRPLLPGTAFGNFRGTRGTIGLVVRRIVNGTPSPKMVLTCAHVLCPFGFTTQDAVEQPPDSDQAVGPNQVGQLTPFFTDLGTPGLKMADAALAQLDPNNQDASSAILGIGVPTGFASLKGLTLAEQRSIPLVRTGATTGPRVPGLIESVSGNFRLSFPELGGRIVIFNTVVLYRTTAQAGDSGAAVLNATNNQVVGLHIGGASGIGIMIPIDVVISVLEQMNPPGRIVLA